MKFLLISLLLLLIITKKDQVLSETVKPQDKNSTDDVVFPPLAISSQIRESLSPANTDVKKTEDHPSYSDPPQEWNEPKTGNVIFLQNSLTLPKNFQENVQNEGRANIMKVDFHHPKEAEKEINEYVKKKTEGKIGDVVKGFSEDTKMVLLYYSLFNGEWQETFDPGNTTVEKFFVDEKTTVDVPLMHLTGRFNTFRDTELPCTVVELPYKDDASMIIVMAEPGKINEVKRGLSAETVQRWKTSLTEKPMQLSIPKISIDSTKDPKLPLHKLGFKTAFADTVDSSGITHDVGLEVAKALFRVKMTVDEKGVDGAVAIVLEAVPTQDPQKAQPDDDRKARDVAAPTLRQSSTEAVLLLQTDTNGKVMTEDIIPGIYISIETILKLYELQNG